MPNFRHLEPKDDLEIVSRVMETVAKQVSSYQMSLEKLRVLRREISMDKSLAKRVSESPEGMRAVLVSRGIPDALAAGMAAEDFKAPDFGGSVGMWTWDCCCTACCVTCVCTGNTSAYENPADRVSNPAAGLNRVG